MEDIKKLHFLGEGGGDYIFPPCFLPIFRAEAECFAGVDEVERPQKDANCGETENSLKRRMPIVGKPKIP